MVDTRSIGTGSDLDFVHFHGVDPPPRRHRPERTPEQGSPLTHPARFHRMSATPPATLDAFSTWLLERAGLCANAYRAVPLHRRLPAVLRRLRVDSPNAAQRLLEARPELLPSALDALLIGVSAFFRDTSVFEYVRASVLPTLLKSRRGVSVIGAGVSNGSELYSIAILLAEAGVLDGSYLLGVDCRTSALAQARKGLYRVKDLSALKESWRERYFRIEDATCQVNAALRRATHWLCADLLMYRPPVCDLILFRNVAIYFEDKSVASVWDKLCSALAPGGFLITGKAEKPPHDFPLQCVFTSIYQKKDAA